jgi:hypothetical protein
MAGASFELALKLWASPFPDAGYPRLQLLRVRKAALQRVPAHLEVIVSGRSAKVVPITKGG